MNPLVGLDEWPADHVAAAVLAVGGTSPAPVAVQTWGPLDREFVLASVTKLLTAMAVLVAVEEGTVALHRPAGPAGSTVAHLLAHASGLGPDGAVRARPGTRRIYSNAGFELLADVVADAAAMPFDRYLTLGVLDPLGMAATSLMDPTAHRSAAHGAVSTVADLVRFAGQLLAPTVIAPATLAEARRVAFPGLAGILPGYGRQDPNDWGLGFELKGTKAPHWTGATNSPGTFGHFGQSGTFLWVDPARSVALVVLTDEPFGPWAMERWPALADAVLAAS